MQPETPTPPSSIPPQEPSEPTPSATPPENQVPPVLAPATNESAPEAQPIPEQPAASPTPQAPGENPGTTMGIIALVLTVIGIGLVGLILGIIALVKSKKAGFGNVPALVAIILNAIAVVIVIPILILLTTASYSGIQERARDSERQTDINSLSSQLEAYFAKNKGYPALVDLNSAEWRAANNIETGVGDAAMIDPSDNAVNTLTIAEPTSTGNAYSYNNLTPDSCVSPTNEQGSPNTGNFCRTYNLSAFQEVDGSIYTKKNLY